MSVFGVAVLFALAAGPAMAAKVELPKANGRIIPATLFLVGTSDKEGRPDAAVIETVQIGRASCRERV